MQKKDEHINNLRGQYRYWFCTINNPESDWKQQIKDLEPTWAHGQLEKGETTSTTHIQAVLYYANPKRGNAFKDIPGWFKGVTKSQVAERIEAYCTKSATRLEGPFEHGKRPFSKSMDYGSVVELAKGGKYADIDPCMLVKHMGNIQKITSALAIASGSQNVRGVWIFGAPGIGKSHFARDTFPGAYIKSQNKWFDGYCSQENIILDDLDEAGKCLSHYLKIWADKYPCAGEVKGGHVGLRHKSLVITSNYRPEELWQGTDLEAI